MKHKERPSLLLRVLKSVGECLDEGSARRLAALRLDARTQAMVDRVANRCTEGKLTEAERSEYLSFVNAMDVVAILQLEARRRLKRTQRAAIT